MHYKLHDYQAEAVTNLAFKVRQKQAEYGFNGNTAAIGLVAPTAAGKTVMAAALLEGLVDGNTKTSGNPNLTVIWVSDQPELNEQSLRKINLASTWFNNQNLLRLGDFDQPVLDGGKVYFTHLQQLSKSAKSFHAVIDGVKNDARNYGVWDMIANTIAAKGASVLLVIDEAHRGTGVGDTTAENAKGRTTIFHTLVHGGTTTVGTSQPAAPVVVGISATPKKFLDSIAKGSMSHDVVSADIAKVRASGLLKDVINIPKPKEKQSADMTLLGNAAKRWRESTSLWTAYHAEHPEKQQIEPIMLVQVADKPSAARLATILDTLAASDAALSGNAVAHCFGTHLPEMVPPAPGQSEKRTIRYLEPQHVDRDTAVKIVLFKTALTTGWDCPRAEVMVSLRTAGDPTAIAQLMGRMVRTPLAERIEDGDPALNSVVLMLPHYDKAEVAKVVKALTEDGDVVGQVNIDTITLTPNPSVPEECLDVLSRIPSTERVAPQYPSEVARAISLAGLLDDYSESKTARKELSTRIVTAMKSFDEQHTEEIHQEADNLLSLEMEETRVAGDDKSLYATSDSASPDYSLRLAEVDVMTDYKKAVKALPEDSASQYEEWLLDHPDDWEHSRWSDGTLDESEAKARVVALHRLGVVGDIEAAAAKQIASWRDKRKSAVGKMPAPIKAEIDTLWKAEPKAMGPTNVVAPAEVKNAPTATLVASKDSDDEPTIKPLPLLDKNLFGWAENTYAYPVKYGSTWESDVLAKELPGPTCKGWYRNPSSGQHALAIPYQSGAGEALLHPDFLFFHRASDDSEIVVDIVDPHLHSNADTAAKWRALAQYADEVSSSDDPNWLRQVTAVIKVGEQLRALDLRDADGVAALDDAKDKAGIEAAFAAEGFDY